MGGRTSSHASTCDMVKYSTKEKEKILFRFIIFSSDERLKKIGLKKFLNSHHVNVNSKLSNVYPENNYVFCFSYNEDNLMNCKILDILTIMEHTGKIRIRYANSTFSHSMSEIIII